MTMPTEEQRVRIMVHYAWDMRDEGCADDALVARLVGEGVPAEIAAVVPGLINNEIAGLIHDDRTRPKLVKEVESAVLSKDFEGLRFAMQPCVDDERTLHKAYSKLAELLVSDSHEVGTLAAYGLSFLIGRGDWPLIEALQHENEMIRYRAAFALGKMGSNAQNAVDSLKQVVFDKDDYVRSAATEALEAIESAEN